jgi:hypothetical protein
MSQADIDAFVDSVYWGTLIPEGVMAAVVTRRVSVNGRHSSDGWTALHWAVARQCRELVVALLAAGADANVKDDIGATSVWWGAYGSTADILQLMIHSGGSVNEAIIDGDTSLMVIVRNNYRDAPARLQVLLACPELDLNATCGARQPRSGRRRRVIQSWRQPSRRSVVKECDVVLRGLPPLLYRLRPLLLYSAFDFGLLRLSAKRNKWSNISRS